MQRDKRPIFLVRPISAMPTPAVDLEAKAFTCRTCTAIAGGWTVEIESDLPSRGSPQAVSAREGQVEVCLRSPKMIVSSTSTGAVWFSCDSSTLRHLAAAILAASNENEQGAGETRRHG